MKSCCGWMVKWISWFTASDERNEMRRSALESRGAVPSEESILCILVSRLSIWEVFGADIMQLS